MRNRLTEIKQGAISIANFQYDALGRRSSKTVSGATTRYLYDGINAVQELSSTSTPLANVVAGGLDQWAWRTEGANTKHFLADALGSARALTDDAKAINTRYQYEPYGETSMSGAASNNSSQYTGRENDGTGLYYYRARYYQPVLKRFISEDPLGLQGGLNTYEYVDGDPQTFVDPNGYFGVPGAVAGAVIGGISGGLGASATGGNVVTGIVLGAIGGFAVGGSGAWVSGVLGQVWMRAGAGALGNTLGQAQQIGTPCFKFNYGSIVGSAVGGAYAGTLAPAAYGTRFAPGFAGFAESAIAGLLPSTASTVGTVIGTHVGR